MKIFKGQVEKFETRQDGSLKLSVCLPKELKDEAVKLTYQTVFLSEAPESEQDVSESMRIVAQQAERIADVTVGLKLLVEELAEKYGLDISCDEQNGGQEGLSLDSPIPDTSENEIDDSGPISQTGEDESEKEDGE